MVDDPPYCFLGYPAHYFWTLLLDTCSPSLPINWPSPSLMRPSTNWSILTS